MSNVQNPGDKNPDAGQTVSNEKLSISTKYKEDPSRTMMACEWHGTEDMRVVSRPAPDITDPSDAIVRITAATICGSDLHMYFNKLPVPSGIGMQKGDIMGHESMGIVDRIGPNVKNVRVGDRVVISAPISCGQCQYCKAEQYSLCDTTNSSKAMEYLYGQRITGVFGYSHLTGGIAGGQAEYCRVPWADVNLLRIPDNLSDEQVLLLTDVLCTGYHGTELAEITTGSKVVVWGCGPVGLAAAYMSKLRGAEVVISIDNDPVRLDKARLFGADVINFDDYNVTEEIAKRIPNGPTNCIDCVGYRFPKSRMSWIQMKLGLETDAVDIVKEMILCARKGARLALIGDYFNYTNGFPIGAMMEKGLSMAGGQLWCQKYWKHLLSLIANNTIDIRFLFSHRYHLKDIPEAYKTFAHHKDDCTKTIIYTDFGIEKENERRQRLGVPALTFGKIDLISTPPVSVTQPIHLQYGNADQQDQLLKNIGSSGHLNSSLAQGSTMSSMGTNSSGSVSSDDTRMH